MHTVETVIDPLPLVNIASSRCERALTLNTVVIKWTSVLALRADVGSLASSQAMMELSNMVACRPDGSAQSVQLAI